MDALALLRLHIEWGADEALEDAAVDRLRPGQKAGGERGSAGAGRRGGEGIGHPLLPREGAGGRGLAPDLRRPDPSPLSPPSGEGGVAFPAARAFFTLPTTSSGSIAASPAERAGAAAAQARTLEDLRAILAAFDGCALRDTAANLVFVAGAPDSSLLLIGEPPGEAEDRSGTPFAGADGALLDRMLASIGLARENLLLTPLMPWRPPGGRPANPGEIAVCLPFLHRLIALAAPTRLLLAGPLAARTLLGPARPGPARRRAGPAWTAIAIPGHPPPIPVLSLPSPAMVARTPRARLDAWATLRLLRRTLEADFAKM